MKHVFYDNTRLVAFKECPRRFYFRHVRHWAGDSSAIWFTFGGAWHAAMDALWSVAGKEPALGVVEHAYGNFCAEWIKRGEKDPSRLTIDDLEELSPRTPMIAKEMLHAYYTKRANIFTSPSFKLVAVEQPFAVPLDPNDPTRQYVGRLDKVFSYEGELRIAEHKCLGKGTLVLRYDGSTCPVEEIRKGDVLMGPDSTPRLVAKTYSGRDKLYKVSSLTTSFVANQAHILSLQAGKELPEKHGYKVGETIHITVKDFFKQSFIFKKNAYGWQTGVQFRGDAFGGPELHPDLPPYLLGVWLGDGNSANQGITTGDPEIKAAVRAYAKEYEMKVREHKAQGCSMLSLTYGSGWNPFLAALQDLNLIGNKHIPMAYKTGSYETRMQVLAGLIDTDGNHLNSAYRISQKNTVLAEDIIYLARSLGFRVSCTRRKGTCTTNGVTRTYNYMVICGDCWKIPIRVLRKKARKKKFDRNSLLAKIKVEPIGTGDYYGFELVGPDRQFLLGDFTVTHNTTTAYRKDGYFRADFLDSFSPNSQVDGYQYAAGPLYNGKLRSIWIDAALVHKTVHDGFKFIPIDRGDSALTQWLWETHHWIDQIEMNKAALAEEERTAGTYMAAFPRNTSSCFGCAFRDPCRALSNPAKQLTPPMGFKIDVWTPFNEIALEKIGFSPEEDVP